MGGRPASVAEVVEHYRQQGLEGSFAPLAGVAATADAGLAAMQPLHWLRPGLLCLAAVTSSGKLLLACSGRGVDSASGWVLAPAVELPLPPAPAPAAGSAPEVPLLLADVGVGPRAALLVAANAGAAGPGQLLLYEVIGMPPPLVDHSRAQQQEHAARLVRIEAAAAAPDAAALSLAFLPSGANSSRRRLLVTCSASSSGTTAAVFTCCSGDSRCESTQWSMAAGASMQLCSAELPAVTAAACQDGATLALLLLPGQQQQQQQQRRQLLCLSSRGDDYGIRLCGARSPLHVPPAHSAAAGGPAGPAAAVAVSPNGVFAAVAAAGSSALLLLPLLEQPSRAAEVDAFMLQIGKR